MAIVATHAATVAAHGSDHGPFSPRVPTQRSMNIAPGAQPGVGGRHQAAAPAMSSITSHTASKVATAAARIASRS